jgi:hypothetical protein
VSCAASRDVRVLRLAGDLAARLGADLHAVQSYDPGTAKSAAAPATIDPLEAERRDAAEGSLALTLAEAAVVARAHVLALPPAEALERVSEQERAGLTAVGPPESYAEDVGLGRSVAIRLAAGGTTALLVLPNRSRTWSRHWPLRAGREHGVSDRPSPRRPDRLQTPSGKPDDPAGSRI